MRNKSSLVWALAAAAGILYLATRAAEAPKTRIGDVPPLDPTPRPDPSTIQSLELTPQAIPDTYSPPPPPPLGFVAPATLESRTAQYDADFRNALVAIEDRSESGALVPYEGPIYAG